MIIGMAFKVAFINGRALNLDVITMAPKLTAELKLLPPQFEFSWQQECDGGDVNDDGATLRCRDIELLL
nr:hypothetical protein HmN_000801300 [Hymenolepis microstoma]CUU98171.1 hypothetical transcript [Hymenolepis microstoma]